MAYQPEKQPEIPWWQPGLIIFAKITGWIAAPIIIALYVGRSLDEKYGTDPWYFLGLTGLAFAISCIAMVVIAGKYIKKIELDNKNRKVIKQDKERNNKKDERRNRY